MSCMHPDTVIFDLDGTLLDTLDDLCASVNFALKANALPERSREEIRSFVGNGIKNLVLRSVPQSTDEEVFKRVFKSFGEHYSVHCADLTKPYEGIIPLVEGLKARGIKTAVVSNKADFAVKKLVELYFPELFDCVAGETEGIARKPAPDTVNSVLFQLNRERENAVYIGDSEVDIQTAANAHIPCISVTWGFKSREFLIENGAKLCADTPRELSLMISE